MRINIFTVMLLAISALFAQSPPALWTQTFGGGNQDAAMSVEQTADGGFITTGITSSFGAGYLDVWLVRTDSEGNQLWAQTFGGADYDVGNAVQQTRDGGYIIVGETRSFGQGSADVWLIRTDDAGNTLWQRAIGDTDFEYGSSVQQTSDNGYIIVGYTSVTGAPYGDAYLIRTDSLGNTRWTQTYGGSEYDVGHAVQQTADGGFIIAGASTVPNQGNNIWLVRTDSLGSIAWTLNHDMENYGDQARSIRQTDDGGFIVAGDYFSENAGGTDIVLLRMDDAGTILWQRTFGDGNTGSEFGYSVDLTADSGYIIAGQTSGFGAGVSDLWLIRTDSTGQALWTQTWGGNDAESARAVRQTTDGGFIVAGSTNSFGAGGTDVWLIRLEGTSTTAIADRTAGDAPQSFELSQNYPNPFNPATTIRFMLARAAVVRLEIFDLMGRRVVGAYNDTPLTAGWHSYRWDGGDMTGRPAPSGVYLYRLSGGGITETRRMLLVR